MVQMLNNKIASAFIFICLSVFGFSQEELETPNAKDYKEPKQFEKFNKRSAIVSAWQINQLKEGAIIVRLKTNKRLIDELLRQGNKELALEKQLEQYAINKNIFFAYKDNFNFCKVYFMYSNSSDSLLNGSRENIFLDSNLTIDPAIHMNEKFYMIAERDYGYNSSIGFVPEDSARTIVERGNPVREMAVVLKNKYGHQLKAPFPYLVKEKNFMDFQYDFPIKIVPAKDGRAASFIFDVNKTFLQDMKENKSQRLATNANDPTLKMVHIKKQFTYEKLAESFSQLNENLLEYFRRSPAIDERKLMPTIKPYLY